MEQLSCTACGSTDYYKKEVKYRTNNGDERTHLQAKCSHCDGYIRNLPQTHKPKTFIPFGKFKGQHTYQISDVEYLRWFHSVCDDTRLKIGIEIRLKELNTGII